MSRLPRHDEVAEWPDSRLIWYYRAAKKRPDPDKARFMLEVLWFRHEMWMGRRIATCVFGKPWKGGFAQEVEALTWESVHEKWGSGSLFGTFQRDQPLRPYLCTIIKNAVRDAARQVRAQYRSPAGVPVDEVESPALGQPSLSDSESEPDPRLEDVSHVVATYKLAIYKLKIGVYDLSVLERHEIAKWISGFACCAGGTQDTIADEISRRLDEAAFTARSEDSRRSQKAWERVSVTRLHLEQARATLHELEATQRAATDHELCEATESVYVAQAAYEAAVNAARSVRAVMDYRTIAWILTGCEREEDLRPLVNTLNRMRVDLEGIFNEFALAGLEWKLVRQPEEPELAVELAIGYAWECLRIYTREANRRWRPSMLISHPGVGSEAAIEDLIDAPGCPSSSFPTQWYGWLDWYRGVLVDGRCYGKIVDEYDQLLRGHVDRFVIGHQAADAGQQSGGVR